MFKKTFAYLLAATILMTSAPFNALAEMTDTMDIIETQKATDMTDYTKDDLSGEAVSEDDTFIDSADGILFAEEFSDALLFEEEITEEDMSLFADAALADNEALEEADEILQADTTDEEGLLEEGYEKGSDDQDPPQLKVSYDMQVGYRQEYDMLPWVLDLVPGEDVTLKARVDADDLAGIRYKWYHYLSEELFYGEDDELEILSTDGDSLTITSPKSDFIILEVSDQYGQTEYLFFLIKVENNLTAYPDGGEENHDSIAVVIPDGQAAVPLEVHVKATVMDGITYAWFIEDEQIEGTGNTNIVPASDGKVTCEVRDAFGNVKTVLFRLFFQSGIDQAPLLEEEVAMDAVLTETAPAAYFRFIPSQSGAYSIFSEGAEGTEAELMDSELNILSESQDRIPEEDTNFLLYYNSFAQGQTYYVKVTWFTRIYEGQTINLKVTAEKVFDNDLIVRPEGAVLGPDGLYGDTAFIQVSDAADKVILRAYISANVLDGITYEWYYVNDDYYNILFTGELESGDNMVWMETSAKEGQYECILTDQYGNQAVAYFLVEVKERIDIGNMTFQIPSDQFEFTGGHISPEVTCEEGLVQGIDYTVTYGENQVPGKNAGTVVIEGVNDYCGTKEITFDILKGQAALTTELIGAQMIEGANGYEAVYGSAVRITADVSHNYGDNIPIGNVSFGSDNEAIASISDAGEVTLKKAGTTTLTVAMQETDLLAATVVSYDLTIVKAPQTISVSSTQWTRYLADGSFELGASAKTMLAYTISDSSAEVLAVDETGRVTPKKAGSAQITLKAGENECYKAADDVIVTVFILNGNGVIDLLLESWALGYGDSSGDNTLKLSDEKLLTYIGGPLTVEGADDNTGLAWDTQTTILTGLAEGTQNLTVYTAVDPANGYGESEKKTVPVRVLTPDVSYDGKTYINVASALSNLNTGSNVITLLRDTENTDILHLPGDKAEIGENKDVILNLARFSYNGVLRILGKLTVRNTTQSPGSAKVGLRAGIGTEYKLEPGGMLVIEKQAGDAATGGVQEYQISGDAAKIASSKADNDGNQLELITYYASVEDAVEAANELVQNQSGAGAGNVTVELTDNAVLNKSITLDEKVTLNLAGNLILSSGEETISGRGTLESTINGEPIPVVLPDGIIAYNPDQNLTINYDSVSLMVESVQEVIDGLNALRSQLDAGTLTLEDKTVVEALASKLNALSNSEKEIVKARVPGCDDIVSSAWARISQLQETVNQNAANSVITKINALPENPSVNDKAAAETAHKAAEAARFTLNVKNGASVPVALKKNNKNIHVVKLGDGDSLAAATSAAPAVVSAKVSGSNVILKGLKPGKSAKVTVATQYGGSVTFTVKVQKKGVAVKTKSIKMAKTTTLKVGETFDITTGINPVTTPDKMKFTLDKNSKKVISVSKKGIITAKKVGTGKLTIQCGNKKKTVTVKVVR